MTQGWVSVEYVTQGGGVSGVTQGGGVSAWSDTRVEVSVE